MDYSFAVRYPFSQEAKAILESANVQLNPRAIELGLERIQKALAGALGGSTAMHKEEQLEEIVSYAAARLILGYCRNRFITNKFAVAEAKRASHYLNQEEESALKKLEVELKLSSEAVQHGYWIPLPQYLRCTPGSPPYKLINRRLQRGRVFTNYHERLRLMEEAIRVHTTQLKSVSNPSENVKTAAAQLKELLPKLEQQPIRLEAGDYPSCIQQLLDDLKRHENLPHHARWYLAVYLLHRGMAIEQIVSLYSNLPDFSEKVTRYQLEHIRKKGYSIPTCATIKSWGLICPGCTRKSPLQWAGKRTQASEPPKDKNNTSPT